MTVGTVEMIIAFSVLLQCSYSGEKCRRKASNSSTVIGRIGFDNKYRILKLNCRSLSTVFANASVVIMVHGYLYIYIFIINGNLVPTN